MTALLVLKKGHNLVVCDLARVIDVKVGKGLLKMLGCQVFRLQGSHYELGIVNLS